MEKEAKENLENAIRYAISFNDVNEATRRIVKYIDNCNKINKPSILECPTCKGVGKVEGYNSSLNWTTGDGITLIICSDCKGTGINSDRRWKK